MGEGCDGLRQGRVALDFNRGGGGFVLDFNRGWG